MTSGLNSDRFLPIDESLEGEKFWEDDVVTKLRNEREAYIENEKQKAEERENNSQTSDRRESTGNVGGARATGGRSRSRNRGF